MKKAQLTNHNDIAERNARAAQYLAEKQYEREQTAEARRDFVIIAVGGILFASIIGGFLNA